MQTNISDSIDLNETLGSDCLSISDDETAQEQICDEEIDSAYPIIEEEMADIEIMCRPNVNVPSGPELVNANRARMPVQCDVNAQTCVNAIQTTLQRSVQSQTLSAPSTRDSEMQTTLQRSIQSQTDLSAPSAQMCDSEMQTKFQRDIDSQTDLLATINQNCQTREFKIDLCDIGTQTTLQACNSATATQTDSPRLITSASQTNKNVSLETSTQTVEITGTLSTQTAITWTKIEGEQEVARETIRKLNQRLGDQVIDSDTGSDDEDAMDVSHDEENFSDAAADSKQYDNGFSAKYSFNSSVSIIYSTIILRV